MSDPTFRDAMKSVAQSLRSTVPIDLDVRPTTLTIRRRVWSGGYRDSGTPTDTDLVLSPLPKARVVTSKEVAESGGKYQLEDVKVGPITPPPNTGVTSLGSFGYSRDQLDPQITVNGTEIIYILSGNNILDGEYQLVNMNTTKSIVSYELVIRRRLTTPE